MGIKKETFIGKVKSVNGSLVSILLDDRIKSTMPILDGIVYRIGQIGSYIKIPLGYAELFGIVTQVGADAIPESIRSNFSEEEFVSSTRWISALLIGEKIVNKFERGVTQYPTTDDEVHIVTIDDLSLIYGDFDVQNSIDVGRVSASESLPARIDLNKLVNRHSAILGSTGSGKSNAVSIILKAIAENDFKSAKILLIDPHGEYNETLKNHSKIFSLTAEQENSNKLNIPFWALSFDELIKIFPGHVSDQQLGYIREEVVNRKRKAAKHLEIEIEESSITSDSPIPFSLKKLWFDLDDFERKTIKDRNDPESLAKKSEGNADELISNMYEAPGIGMNPPFINQKKRGILSFLDSIRNKLVDQRYDFFFKCDEWEPDLEGKVESDLDELFINWFGHDKPITILDLSGIPSEIMVSVSGSILNIIYESVFWGQNLPVGGRKQPILFVLEEAHNYLKAGKDSIASRSVQKIAKEGRKYGAGLLLVTQRPTELDETVLSQCGTLIALRMSNKKDRSFISAAVQEELYDLVSVLPSLRTGEGLVTGEAVRIPSRIKFDLVPVAPKSRDPEVSKQWRKEKPNTDSYKKVIENWRNERFRR